MAASLASQGATVGARDVSNWLVSVESAFSRDGGGPAGPQLSLDSALELGLDPGGLGDRTKTAAGAPAVPARGEASPVRPRPAAATEGDQTVGAAISASTPSVLVQRTSRAAMAVLIVFNLLLLTAVGFLLYRLGLSEEVRPEKPRAAAVTPKVRALPASVDPLDSPPTDARRDTSTQGDDGGATRADGSGPTEPGLAGTAFGAALARLTPVAEKEPQTRARDRVRLTILPSPVDASVSIKGHGTARGQRSVSVSRGSLLRVTVAARGHETKLVRVRADSDKTQRVTLTSQATGWVTFRFFPANARVTIDGRGITTAQSNLVKKRLPVGQHSVTVSRGAARRTVRFRVDAEQTTNLKTVRLRKP